MRPRCKAEWIERENPIVVEYYNECRRGQVIKLNIVKRQREKRKGGETGKSIAGKQGKMTF